MSNPTTNITSDLVLSKFSPINDTETNVAPTITLTPVEGTAATLQATASGRLSAVGEFQINAATGVSGPILKDKTDQSSNHSLELNTPLELYTMSGNDKYEGSIKMTGDGLLISTPALIGGIKLDDNDDGTNNWLEIDHPIQLGADGARISNNSGTTVLSGDLRLGGNAGPTISYDSTNQNVAINKPLRIEGAPLMYNNQGTLTIAGPVQVGSINGPILSEDANDSSLIINSSVYVGESGGPLLDHSANMLVVEGSGVQIGSANGPVISEKTGTGSNHELLINKSTEITKDLTLKRSNNTAPTLTLESDASDKGSTKLQTTQDSVLSLQGSFQINSSGTSGPILSEKTGAGTNHELFIDKGVQIGTDTGPILSSNNNNLGISAPIVLEHKTGSTDDSQTITPTMTADGSKAAGPGIEFSGDAQFNIPNPVGSGTVKVRISDLYDPNANIEQLANILSAVCRRVYTYKNTSAAPTVNPSTGEIHPNGYGELTDDAGWIAYFALKNLDNGAPPSTS